MVEHREEKATMFEALMQKLQPTGGYKPFDDKVYDTALKSTAVYKLVSSQITCKFKFGQHLSAERFEMIIEHLKQRNTQIDKETIEMMTSQKGINHAV